MPVRHLLQWAWGWAALSPALLGYGFAQPAKSLSAALTGAAVSGAVYDTSEAVVEGASVTLGVGDRDLLRTTTDAKGEFRFETVAAGHYELRAAYPGFNMQRTRLTVGTRARERCASCWPSRRSKRRCAWRVRAG